MATRIPSRSPLLPTATATITATHARSFQPASHLQRDASGRSKTRKRESRETDSNQMDTNLKGRHRPSPRPRNTWDDPSYQVFSISFQNIHGGDYIISLNDNYYYYDYFGLWRYPNDID